MGSEESFGRVLRGFKALLGPVLEASELPNPLKIHPKLEVNLLLAPNLGSSGIFAPLGNPI